jgi:hypothetical protein
VELCVKLGLVGIDLGAVVVERVADPLQTLLTAVRQSRGDLDDSPSRAHAVGGFDLSLYLRTPAVEARFGSDLHDTVRFGGLLYLDRGVGEVV